MLVLAGERCERIMGQRVRIVKLRDIEMDEVWSFIGKKEKRVRPEDDRNMAIASRSSQSRATQDWYSISRWASAIGPRRFSWIFSHSGLRAELVLDCRHSVLFWRIGLAEIDSAVGEDGVGRGEGTGDQQHSR